jgi:RNA polymerase sigma factor (sigma-70 family)
VSAFEHARALAQFLRARPDLLRYLTRFTGDRDLAEDLVQETWVRMRERPPTDGGGLRGWLFRVATNLARDHARQVRQRAALLATARDRVPPVVEPPDPLEVVERADRRRQVRQALAALSEKERTALLMREEGFTHREIAEVVQTTTASVGWLLARALAKVAAGLGPEVRDATRD